MNESHSHHVEYEFHHDGESRWGCPAGTWNIVQEIRRKLRAEIKNHLILITSYKLRNSAKIT